MSINSRLQFFSKIFKRSSDLETYMSKASGKSARTAAGAVIDVIPPSDVDRQDYPTPPTPYLTERYQKEIELTASSSTAATDANIKARYDHVNRVFHGYPDKNGAYHTGESNWFVAETGLAPVPHTTPYVLFEGNPSTGQITAIAFDTGRGLFEVPASDETMVVGGTTYHGWGDPDNGYLYTIGSSDPENPPVVKVGDPVYQYQEGSMAEFAFPVASVVLDGFASLYISSGANMEVSDNGTTWSAWPSYPDGYAEEGEEGSALNGRVPAEDKKIGEVTYYAWNDQWEELDGYYYTTTDKLAVGIHVYIYNESESSMSESWVTAYVETWTTFLSAPVSNGKLYVRGKSGETSVWGLSGAFTKVSGNVMSLVDYEDPSLAELSESQFNGMNGLFQNCTSLIDASELELPAETLADECYYNMFNGCTSLVAPPSLPALTLAPDCYSSMFDGCTSLTQAPVLPALTAKSYCYGSMFQDCTSLTSAPSLPAETLDTECYASMFSGCTSLEDAPSILPATTLAWRCYQSMFQGCTSLTSAPSLPAETLDTECYASMFSGCTSLEDAPSILPATTLKDYCYWNMFNSCTSLTNPPTISATSFDEYSCNNMFNGCTSLSVAPSLDTQFVKQHCCDGMFYGCTSLSLTGVTIKLASNLKSNCYFEMFRGCTSITDASSVIFKQGANIADSCYRGMFRDCSGLVTAPELPTHYVPSNPGSAWYISMFNGCTHLTGPVIIHTQSMQGVYYTGSMFTNSGTAEGCGGIIKVADSTEKWDYERAGINSTYWTVQLITE